MPTQNKNKNKRKYQRLFRIRSESIETPTGRQYQWVLYKLRIDGEAHFSYKYFTDYPTWQQAMHAASKYANMYIYVGLMAPK
jgi:hypothetical protein